MKFIRMKNNIYEVKEEYFVPQKIWKQISSDIIIRIRDVIIRNGERFFACNKAEDVEFVEIERENKSDTEFTSSEKSCIRKIT